MDSEIFQNRLCVLQEVDVCRMSVQYYTYRHTHKRNPGLDAPSGAKPRAPPLVCAMEATAHLAASLLSPALLELLCLTRQVGQPAAGPQLNNQSTSRRVKLRGVKLLISGRQ